MQQLRSRPQAFSFDFQGLGLEVHCDSPELLDHVRRDFAWFHRPSTRAPELAITVELTEPDYERLPPLRASFVTPRNVCYRDGQVRIVDYFGRGLLLHDRDRVKVQASDLDMAREIVYLFILSTAGRHFDRSGLTRLHALALAHGGRAALLLLPSGGGKSTLGFNLLGHEACSLLSEDSPLIDRRGTVHPFPLCLGVKGSHPPAGVPDRFQRLVRRMEFDPKILVDLEFYADKIGREPVPPGWLLLGQRSLGREASLEPLPRLEALRALVANMVVGLGIYQGLEFMLERGPAELAGKSGLLLSRFRNALALLRRCQSYRFVMGRDLSRNAEVLLELLAR